MTSSAFVSANAPGPSSGLIEVLSWRTYPSLVSAMREVVSNSSDADATRLNITLSRTYDADLGKRVYKLTFFDDGEGMTTEEFENYLRLCGRNRRQRTGTQSTSSGRPIIGMLGIGSLAVAPWSERVEILTKKPNSTQILHVKIAYGKFFDDANIRETDLYGSNGEYKYQKRLEELDPRNTEASEIEKGFTILDLVGLNARACNELFDGPEWPEAEQWNTAELGLLGEGYRDEFASTARQARKSLYKFTPLLRFMHRLALMIPLPYPEGTPVRYPPIRTMVDVLLAQCMNPITFQGVQLHRPMLILDQQNPEDRGKAQPGKVEIGGSRAASAKRARRFEGAHITIDEVLPKSKVRIRGYIWGQNSQIKYEELTGIQVRIRNVGIGPYNFALFDPAYEVDAPRATRAVRAQAISGEIFVDYSDELEWALRGDREGFQEGSDVYRELKEAVYKHIKQMYRKIDSFNERKSGSPKGQAMAPVDTSQPSNGAGTGPAYSSPREPSAGTNGAGDDSSPKVNSDEKSDPAGHTGAGLAPTLWSPPAYRSEAERDGLVGQHAKLVALSIEGASRDGLSANAASSTGGTTQTPLPTDEVLDSEQQGGADYANWPGAGEQAETSARKRYFVVRAEALDVLPPAATEEIARSYWQAGDIVVEVSESMLPTSLGSDAVDRVCVVVAALSAAACAKQAGCGVTALVTAAGLIELPEEPDDAC